MRLPGSRPLLCLLFLLLSLAGCASTKSDQRGLAGSAPTPPSASVGIHVTPAGSAAATTGPGSQTLPSTLNSIAGATTLASSSGFASGINVAWVHFGADVGTGSPDIATLQGEFAKVAGAGGKIARLWLHTDGSVTPTFNGMNVTGPGATTAADLTKILDAAHAQGIQLMLTLWSFDMLRATTKPSNPDLVPRNRLLLTNDASLTLYLDQALTPLVTAVKDHPALYAWDIVNEPEGLTAGESWGLVDASDRITNQQIQVFVNRIAGRIHQIAPKNLATSGALSYKYLSPTVGQGNLYTDAALRQAGGDALGYLDFYQVHHYASIGTAFSPFLHPASYFGADKPVLVGEFAMQEYLDHGTTSPRLLYAKLAGLGYMGAFGWQDAATPAMNLMLNAMVYMQFPGDLGADPTLCSHFSGGFGQPFFAASNLYRLRTANADGSDPNQRCLVE